MRTWWKILGAIAIVTAVALIAALVIGHLRGPVGDADAMVARAAGALTQTAVRGTVVTKVRTPTGEKKLRARIHRGDGRAVLEYLTGDAHGVRVHRQHGAVWVEGQPERGSRRADLRGGGLDADLLSRNWTFSTGGTRRVAGRTTTLVQGVGPGGTLTIAVDRETGFPLHMSRRGPDGAWISQTTWVEADFSVAPPPKLEPPPPREEHHRTPTTLAEARAAVKFAVLEPTWLPEGWRLQAWYLHDRARRTMVQARCTDGLRPLVIIQTKRLGLGVNGEEEDGIRDPRERRGDSGTRAQHRRDDPRMRGRGERLRVPDPRGPAQRHMRGFGGDASRRVIGETLVVVIGSVSAADRERILDGMSADE